MKSFDAISQKHFENSIIKLCKSLSSQEIEILDFILTQEKEEAEILRDIVNKFPNFKTIYSIGLIT